MMSTLQTKGAGIDKKYSSITEVHEPGFRRDLNKNEGLIEPDKGSSIRIANKKMKAVEQQPYEAQIENRCRQMESMQVGYQTYDDDQ